MSNNTVLEVPRIRISTEDTSSSIKNGNIRSTRTINVRIRGSDGNLASSFDGLFLSDRDLRPDRTSYTLSETDDEEYVRFRGLVRNDGIANSDSTGPTIVVDPPSPPFSSASNADTKIRNDHVRTLSDCRRREYVCYLTSFCFFLNFEKFFSDIVETPYTIINYLRYLLKLHRRIYFN